MFSNPRLFRLFGASVHVHSTFFIFAAIFYWLQIKAHPETPGWLFIAYYLCAFASILVHEFGHVFVARLHGIDCRKITLHGLGGLAHLDSAPSRPRDEFLIAFAGPVTSLLLAGVLWGVSTIAPAPGFQDFLQTLVFVNVMIAAFNMIPAYPLDGGQMLHAVLRIFFSSAASATAASVIAQMLGVGLVVAGWHFGLMNMIIIGALLFFLSPSSMGRKGVWSLGRRNATPDDGVADTEIRSRS